MRSWLNAMDVRGLHWAQGIRATPVLVQNYVVVAVFRNQVHLQHLFMKARSQAVPSYQEVLRQRILSSIAIYPDS